MSTAIRPSEWTHHGADGGDHDDLLADLGLPDRHERSISLGMFIAGISAFLFLRTSADASFLDVLPAMMVMGFLASR